jgi:hypothetical protein
MMMKELAEQYCREMKVHTILVNHPKFIPIEY